MMNILCTYQIFLLIFPQACPEYKRTNEIQIFAQFINKYVFANTHLPDTAKNPFSYLEEHKYIYKNHSITTDDGYILLAVRIPHGKKRSPNKKRPPVVFVHAMYGMFYDFLNPGPERAIGFQILEQGYDVWLLNCRGSTYSRNHVFLDSVLNASTYWNFSWHEMGFYDVPATIDYISNNTGYSNISIVGHSQGGTVYLAFAASRPEYAKRITFSLQLAPVSYLKNARVPLIDLFADNLDLLYKISEEYNIYELVPEKKTITQIIYALCNINSPLLFICHTVLQVFAGPSNQLNSTIFSVIVTNDPAGGSMKQWFHYIQLYKSGNFQLYDYGTEGNKIKYNQITPPQYNLSVVTAPVAIYYGKSDYFVSVADGARMISELPNALPFVLGEEFNHIDVQWGNKALKKIHRPAIKLLNKYNALKDNF